MRRVARGGRRLAFKLAPEERDILDRMVARYFYAKRRQSSDAQGAIASQYFSIQNFMSLHHEVYAELASMKTESLRAGEDCIPIVTLSMGGKDGFLIVCHCDDFIRAARRVHMLHAGHPLDFTQREVPPTPAQVVKQIGKAEQLLPHTSVYDGEFDADEL